ncbi:MAG: HAD-IA family hydrolase [Bacilli bacterium]|nr:HAD-IA family hydrolase [Bacilli bacterium]
MIKVVAFDLIGVLIGEKNIDLSSDEDKLERIFGPNLSDTEFIKQGKEKVNGNIDIMNTAENIIFKLYYVRQDNVFEQLKEKYKDIKLIIATNHISVVRKYIEKVFNIKYLDDIIISAEINKIKPNEDFYQYILDKYGILPKELLFLDDNQENVDGAKRIGINTIKIDRETDILNAIINYLENQ